MLAAQTTAPSNLLVTNGRVCTFGETPRLIENGAVLITGDAIAAVGDSQALAAAYPDADELDAQGMLVMPGMICAHTHFYGAFARGMYIPGPPMADFREILERLWWPLDRALNAEGVRYSALTPLVDAIRYGTTTLIDHHASNRFVDGSLDVIAEAVIETGLRACLCYEVTDRDGPEVAAAGIRENARFIRKARAAGSPHLAATFGLHAALTLGDDTLDRSRPKLKAWAMWAFTSMPPKAPPIASTRWQPTTCARSIGWLNAASWGRQPLSPMPLTSMPGRWVCCVRPVSGSAISPART